MNIYIDNVTIVLPGTTTDSLKSALTEAILDTQNEDSDCFFDCEDDEGATTGDKGWTSAELAVNAWSRANAAKQEEKNSANRFWLLAETIYAHFSGSPVVFGLALADAVNQGDLRTKVSKAGNPLYMAA
jgi:hypothetical protein